MNYTHDYINLDLPVDRNNGNNPTGGNFYFFENRDNIFLIGNGVIPPTYMVTDLLPITQVLPITDKEEGWIIIELKKQYYKEYGDKTKFIPAFPNQCYPIPRYELNSIDNACDKNLDDKCKIRLRMEFLNPSVDLLTTLGLEEKFYSFGQRVEGEKRELWNAFIEIMSVKDNK